MASCDEKYRRPSPFGAPMPAVPPGGCKPTVSTYQPPMQTVLMSFAWGLDAAAARRVLATLQSLKGLRSAVSVGGGKILKVRYSPADTDIDTIRAALFEAVADIAGHADRPRACRPLHASLRRRNCNCKEGLQ